MQSARSPGCRSTTVLRCKTSGSTCASFGLTEQSRGDLLVLGAAGGVGSIMIQLAKALTGVRVIATASRDDSRAWALRMGADVVIDHHALREEALAAAPDGIDYLFSPHS